MKLVLSFTNLLPEIAVKKVDLLGYEITEKLGEGEFNPLATARACVEARPHEEQRLTLQLETLPANVNGIHIGMYMHERDTTQKSQSAVWELKHGDRRLHSGTILLGKELERAVRTIRLSTPAPRRPDVTLVFKRSPLSFTSDDGTARARYWTIYNIPDMGQIWGNYKSVSEADPDPVQPSG